MLTMSSIANNQPHVMRKRLILRQFMQVDQYNTFVVHYLVVVYLWFRGLSCLGSGADKFSHVMAHMRKTQLLAS